MKTLLVSPFSPVPARKGAQQRTRLMWEALARLGEVDLVLHSSWDVPAETVAVLQRDYRLVQYHVTPDPVGSIFELLLEISNRRAYEWARHYATRRAYYSVVPSAAADLRSLTTTGGYDAVVVRYLRCACRSGLLGLPQVCIDLDDYDPDIYASAARDRELSWLRRFMYARHGHELRRLMRPWLRQVSLVWLANGHDLAKVSAPRAQVMPNAIDATTDPVSVPVRSGSTTLLFVGSLDWEPNQSGLRRFIREVLPGVRRQVPGTVLRVIGSSAPAALQQLLRSSPGVDYVGEVADVGPYYANSRCAVIPTASGSGSHIKIPESFYYGIPCVTSPLGHRGYEETLPAGEAVLVARSAAEFVQACVALLRDEALCLRLAATGLEAVRLHYTKDAFCRRVAASLRELPRPPRTTDNVTPGS